MIRIDLHTHSEQSPDGGLDEDDYWSAITRNELDIIAITDHGTVDFAKYLHKQHRFANSIIVGQEVMSSEGEIVGLFLQHSIPDHQTPEATVAEIKKQGGFVLIPHPADRYRKGLKFEIIKRLGDTIDAIEGYNGRTIRNAINITKIRAWAKKNNIPVIANSDAHSKSGIGKTYTRISEVPSDTSSLKHILGTHVIPVYKRSSIRAFAAPKINRIRNKVLS